MAEVSAERVLEVLEVSAEDSEMVAVREVAQEAVQAGICVISRILKIQAEVPEGPEDRQVGRLKVLEIPKGWAIASEGLVESSEEARSVVVLVSR